MCMDSQSAMAVCSPIVLSKPVFILAKKRTGEWQLKGSVPKVKSDLELLPMACKISVHNNFENEKHAGLH